MEGLFGGNCLVFDKTLGWNYLHGKNLGWNCGGVELSGVELSTVEFSGMELSGVELSGVELSRVEMFGLRRNSRVELFAWK